MLCIKCGIRDAVPGGNLCKEDAFGGSGTNYAYQDGCNRTLDRRGPDGPPPSDDDDDNDRQA